jgi:uncharacterized alpha-E superfamily protein
VNLLLSLDMTSREEQWLPLVEVTGDADWFQQKYGPPSRRAVIQFLCFEREYANSIYSCLRQARENARTIREIISSEVWEQINKFFLMVRRASEQSPEDVAHSTEFFTEVKNASHLCSGLINNTMTHNEAWHFCRLGQLIERADKTSRILDVKYFYLLPSPHDVGSTLDEMQWAAVLRSASALEMYRKRFGRIAPPRVAEFLVLDREFPRAMQYCILKAQDSLHAIAGSPEGTFCNAAEQRLGQLCAELAFSQAADIVHKGLHEFLDAFQSKLNGVGAAIHDTYFALQPVSVET